MNFFDTIKKVFNQDIASKIEFAAKHSEMDQKNAIIQIDVKQLINLWLEAFSAGESKASSMIDGI